MRWQTRRGKEYVRQQAGENHDNAVTTKRVAGEEMLRGDAMSRVVHSQRNGEQRTRCRGNGEAAVTPVQRGVLAFGEAVANGNVI